VADSPFNTQEKQQFTFRKIEHTPVFRFCLIRKGILPKNTAGCLWLLCMTRANLEKWRKISVNS
jgi:hypothetical protein